MKIDERKGGWLPTKSTNRLLSTPLLEELNMATLAASTPTRKPAAKSFYATLYDAHGIMGKVDGVIYFFADDGTITEFSPEMSPWVCILAETGIADTQAILDRMHGGAAWIATHRAQEVA